MQQYQISNVPQRYQLAQHFHSSLDQPNLDNVQAKLYAIRQRNYQMAQQFFQQKFGTPVAYDHYLQQSNMTDLKPPKSPYEEYQNQIDLRQHLAHKAFQIQQEQKEKIQRVKQFGGKLTNKRPQSSKKNPWLNSQNSNNQALSKHYGRTTESKNYNFKSDQTEQQLEGQYQDDPCIQMVDLRKSKDQQKKGQFISQFKQYLANKNKFKSNPKQALNQSSSKLERSINNNSNLGHSKAVNESVSMKKSQQLNKSGLLVNSSKASCPQEQLVKKIFKNINGKKGSPAHDQNRSFLSNPNNEYVQKIQLAQYLTQNQRILDVLNIGPEQIIQRLHRQLQTKDANKVKYHQCLLFVYQLLGKEQEQKKLLVKHCFSDIPEGCMLQLQVVRQFQKIFRQLDKPCDLIVKRLDFIQKLALNPLLSKIMNAPAVYEPNLNKAVSLRRVFQRIQIQTLLCSQEDSKAKQYISWGQFIKYFQSGHCQRGKYDILRLIDSLKEQEEQGFCEIPQFVFQVIQTVVKRVDKGEQYFSAQDLVGQILINKLYEVQKYSFIRGRGNSPKSGNVPMQTFQDTLRRIRQTAPKYLTVKQFLEFFSVRGQPIQLAEQQLHQKVKAVNQAVKVATVEEQIFGKEDNQVQGYDSDPQFYNNSHFVDRKQFRKTLANANKNSSAMKANQDYLDYQDIAKPNIKVTVPKPFKFQQRQKQRAYSKQINRLNRSASLNNFQQETQFKFKAKQIPQKVKQQGLYQQIIEQNQRKIQDRKKCSMLLTLANEQPFSFYNRKAQKKTKYQREQFQFQANPIPWYCSVNLLKKIQEKNINRNQKIARMAQQSLSRARLPPRMQKDFQQKLAIKILQSAKRIQRPQSVIKAKQPPNFEHLHKQFQSALQRKRKQNKTTQIKQFNFSQINKQKKAPKDLHPQYQQQNLQNLKNKNKQQKWRKTLKSSINVFASSTAKLDQQVQKRRKQIEEKKRKQSQKLKGEQQRKIVNQDLSRKLREQTQSKKENKKDDQLIQTRRNQMKQQQENFKVRKAQWLSNAAKQPLLVQRPLKRDIRIQKMKRLHQISQNLKKNGIKGRQHDQYFKRDQLLMLQDYQFLLQKGQKI